MMDDLHPRATVSRHPQFSLLAGFLLMAIVAMTLFIMLLWREVAPLRAKLRQLRDEFGALSVGDPSKFHAIRVESHADFTWNWRVWIPDGQAYELRYVSDDIQPRGFPSVESVLTLHGPDEQWIGHRIRRDPTTGKRVAQLVTQQGTFYGSEQTWIGKSRSGEIEGLPTTTTVFEPGHTIQVIRCRYSRVDDNSDYDKPGDGFMIWLVPVNKNGSDSNAKISPSDH
jgi:hypothetical protein